MQLNRRSLLALTVLLASTTARAEPALEKTPPAPPKLQLKNAQSIRVNLGYKRQHEPASGIRPEKGPVWNVIARTDLTGSSAELLDVTPDVPRSRWQAQFQGDKLVLDGHRFVPSHVYQLDVRKEKKLVGTVLVYLYPPPSGSGTEKVEFKDEEAAGKKGESAKKGEPPRKGAPADQGNDSGELARVPKGGL